ncbi:MAG: NAD(P)(+) transhydrogenase (Re/Si-specific) subunit beta [Dactylosporangium sp.]|nr:NAD(P)(+) transhydrogenase (Re/Si-specific) subunit beta [Dactylosporangium sp.]NNJ59752.1 NAD(P)(+) transhydrogenase (Re/Si-specific) subunit beta [Dactylosporangium sp.]
MNDLSVFDAIIRLIYLGAATCFVLGLHLMNTPATAKRGNRLSMLGMGAGVAAAGAYIVHAAEATLTAWTVLILGAAIGSGLGLTSARRVQMTAMPQLVSLFNAVGGGAAALIGVHDLLAHSGGVPVSIALPAMLDVVIGGVTFSGSLVASGKLQGLISGRPIVFPGARVVNAVLALVLLGVGAWVATGTAGTTGLVIEAVAALGFGVAMVLPIGGADMPVVISLLNACTGTAVAMAGFVIGNTVLIIAGALVGASGGILTKLMADAMNRSLTNIVIGGFGTGDGPGVLSATDGAPVRELAADDAAILLGYADKVIIVPGYGLAAAQAQHACRELAELLEERGAEVAYAIHPVAGRMPGHMNVLLAEANVPYGQMKEMEEINPEFPRTDVALVIGANDVTNPAARRSGNPVSGMPILDVDKARNIIVIKRSMGHGYAGIDNELYTDARTGMFFADAKAGLATLTAAVKAVTA